MASPDPTQVPDGLEVVTSWVERIHSGIVDTRLWEPLEDVLRLCYAQMFIYNNKAWPDDKLADDLAQRHSQHPDFMTMLEQHVQHWRGVYRSLANGIAYLGSPESVGVDLEYIALFDPKFVGEFDQPLPANSFLVRWVNDRWLIAANSRRLPAPGWPPTDKVIPGLRVDGNY